MKSKSVSCEDVGAAKRTVCYDGAASRSGLAGRATMKGQLFTQFFLADGIRTTPEWDVAGPKLADFRRDVGSVHARF